jgi:hypothetical protein
VKRTPLAFVIAIRATQDFSKEPLRIGASGEQVAVVSMRGEEIIARPQAGNRRHTRRLLPDIEVIVAAKDVLIMQRYQALFEVANDKHPPA